MTTDKAWWTTHLTRFPELGYSNFGRNLWRVVVVEDDAPVGPFYRSKAELLADLDRYAREYGVNP